MYVLLPAMLGPVIRASVAGCAELGVVGHEAVAQQVVEHGVAAGGDLEDRLLHHVGADPAVPRGHFGEAGDGIQAGHGVGEANEVRQVSGGLRAQFVEEGALAGDGA
jgi:hypothetical protein